MRGLIVRRLSCVDTDCVLNMQQWGAAVTSVLLWYFVSPCCLLLQSHNSSRFVKRRKGLHAGWLGELGRIGEEPEMPHDREAAVGDLLTPCSKQHIIQQVWCYLGTHTPVSPDSWTTVWPVLVQELKVP